MRLRWVVLSMLGVLLPAVAGAQVAAQGGEIAEYVRLIDEEVVPAGSVVQLTEEGTYRMSSEAFAPDVVGVTVGQPAIAINLVGTDGAYPLVRTGEVLVRVSGEGGDIAPGDTLVTSPVAGVAMKATESGFAVGTALESFTGASLQDTGQVRVLLETGYRAYVDPDATLVDRVTTTVGDAFSLSSLAALEEPGRALRYVVAATVLLLSFAFGFFVFGRIATNGITAIGRNPLARRFIEVGIVFNVGITIAIVLAGLAVAVFIIVI